MGDVLSNVIGAPFSPYIINQLKLRANLGSTTSRTNEQVLYLANKMSWTRLSSFIRIKPAEEQPLSKFYANLFDGQIPPGDYSQPDSLAKNWILQNGTSEYNNDTYNLRFGLGPNSAYGLGGIEQQGYRPMPGLTSITIDTKGTLGSLREATVNFQAWNMTQLNVIEALYFRLGFTMLLEWGHASYFNNDKQYVTNPYGLDVFNFNSKEKILQAVTQRNIETNGNYDAMLGTVTNFFFSFNAQGGYDCSLKLIGLGSIIDTLRINQTFTMPSTLQKQVQQAQELLDAEKNKTQNLLLEKQRIDQGLPGVLPEIPKDVEGIKNVIRALFPKITDTEFSGVNTQINNASFPSTQYIGSTESVTAPTGTDYYYKAEGLNLNFNSELNNSRAGLFLNKNPRRTAWQIIPADVSNFNPVPVTLDGNALQNLSSLSRRGGYTVQTVDISRKQYKATDFFDSAPNDSTAKTHVVDLLDAALKDAKWSSVISISGISLSDPVEKSFVLFVPYRSGGVQKFYAFTIAASSKQFRREQYIQALDTWFTTSLTVDITSVQVYDLFGRNDIFVKGNLTNLDIDGEKINATFETNDTGLINKVENRAPKKDEPTPQIGSAVDSQGNTVGEGDQTNAAQTEQREKFNSSLHTMLNTVKAIGQAKGIGATDAVVPVDLVEITQLFFQSGILQNVIPTQLGKTQQTGIVSNEVIDFELTSYAKKGFNSNLMADKTKFSKIKDIDWKELCTAYYVGYEFSDNGANITSGAEKPIYIKLGYLLAFLNNMCLLYESISKKNSGKENTQNTVKPYTYIDFHPDFNFCLTAPQHMTIDPSKCFIPLVCSNSEYEDLFNVDIKTTFENNIFKPETASRLSALKAFKTGNAYQGKTMEILLNTQFLLDLADRFIASDRNSALNLKPFLDAVMDEVTKSTGNFNLFRVAYRDDSNTIIIKDDQWTPNLEGEDSAIEKQSYLDHRQYMELQVFGSGSLVRDMEFKTNMNTKMSSMIAISAQSGGNAFANGVDASPIAIYNTNYEDAIMQVKQDVSTDSAKDTKTFNKQLDQEVEQRLEKINTNNQAAIKFNSYVESIYYGGRVPISQTENAKYYQDRLTELKAREIITTAAPFIPANLSITLDGISGIVMGNAFCIPESRLPASLRGGKGDFTKVGFAVVGLTHTLENNQWLTKIRGQMINLRDKTSAKTADIKSNINSFDYINTISEQTVDLKNANLNADWVTIAFQFIIRY